MSEAVKASDYLIEGLLRETLFQFAEAEMTAIFPFLAIPGVRQVAFYFFEKYADVLLKKVAFLSASMIIEAEVNHEVKAVKEASKDYLASIKSQDPEQIKKAKDEFKKRLAVLLRVNP